jgi:hypothetical protein
MDIKPRYCITWNLIVRPREIHFLRFIMEAYEGITTVTTLQPQLGLVRLSIAPGCEEEVEKILRGEADRLQHRFTTTVQEV